VPYHYVVVRRDMPHGDQLAQVLHASALTAAGTTDETFAAVLGVADEAELLRLHEVLEAARVGHALVREPDPPHDGAATALGIPPQPRGPLRRLLRHLRPAGGT
jgi:hypothetical protein